MASWGIAHSTNRKNRVLRVLDLNLPFDKFLSLGGRSEEISQICVVWGKAVALSRYHLSHTTPREPCWDRPVPRAARSTAKLTKEVLASGRTIRAALAEQPDIHGDIIESPADVRGLTRPNVKRAKSA